MSITESPDDLQVLAGEYVLGTLSATRREVVEARMKNDAALRTAVEIWEEKLSPLSALVEPTEPSAALWSRIESSIAATPSVASRVFAKPPSNWWNSLNLWRGLTATGFAAAALMGVVIVTNIAQPPTSGYMVVLVG
ncbi:MAG: RNA polymerase subunit sigma-70, partial [Casimicrobium sp.]